MKKIIIVMLLGLFFSCSSNVENKNANIRFKEVEHNFGELPFRTVVKYDFEFSNPSENPLLIYDVKTSCGCTVAQWTKKPIKPGKSGKITVKYTSEFPGRMFHKEITVFYNGINSPVGLKISGKVELPEDEN